MAEKEKVANRYDRWASFYDSVDTFPIVGRPQEKWKNNAIDALDLSGGERVLDIGTGTGRILPKISQHLNEGEVIGIDISEGMLKRSRERIKNKGIHEQASAKYDDILDSKFPDNYFDSIIATFTFTTLPNPRKAAEECARILKKDGSMIVLDTGRPENSYGKPLFYPMMISAKIFGRTHMDRDIEQILENEFEVERINSHMVGMVYTLECKIKK